MATAVKDVTTDITSKVSGPANTQGLVPTNIAGAFAHSAPPANFPRNKADKAGAPSAGTWLMPQQVAKPDVVHRPTRRPSANGAVEELTNWGGSALAGSWNSCQGSWTVPTVSKPSEGAGADGGWNSSTWVGLDGYGGSDDVLQAGIEQDVDSNGNATYYAWYEWFCNIQRQTLGDTSPVRPGMASLNNVLYLAWTGNDNMNLNIITSSDRGQTFQNKYVSQQFSPFAPALCAHQGKLFIAWTGTGNQNVNISQVLLDGNGVPTGIQAPPVTLNSISEQGPSLASFNGNLYVAFIGKDNQLLNFVVSADGGVTFPHEDKFISTDTSPDTPAMVAHNGQLFVSWKGDGNDQLNIASTTFNGPAVSALVSKVVLGDTSPYGPSLVSNGTTMYMAWRGDGNDQLNMMQSSDGVSFGGKYVSGETSADAPVLAFYGPDLFIGWKGDGNDNLNASLVGIVNGAITGFSTAPYRSAVAIANFPVSPGDAITCSAVYAADLSTGQISMSNTSKNVSFAITLVPPPGATMNGDSAEWVIEVPTVLNAIAHLPSFTQFAFTGASAGGAATGNAQNGTVVIIDDDSNSPLTNTVLGDGTVTINYV